MCGIQFGAIKMHVKDRSLVFVIINYLLQARKAVSNGLEDECLYRIILLDSYCCADFSLTVSDDKRRCYGVI